MTEYTPDIVAVASRPNASYRELFLALVSLGTPTAEALELAHELPKVELKRELQELQTKVSEERHELKRLKGEVESFRDAVALSGGSVHLASQMIKRLHLLPSKSREVALKKMLAGLAVGTPLHVQRDEEPIPGIYTGDLLRVARELLPLAESRVEDMQEELAAIERGEVKVEGTFVEHLQRVAGREAIIAKAKALLTTQPFAGTPE